MKAEINNENKARFIALYIPYGEIFKTSIEGHLLKVKIEDISLNLKPISSISEEDALLVCSHHKVLSSDNSWSVNSMITLDGHSTDFLRSKGYALHWMGLSVEEMIEAGWIKLIEQ